LRPLLRKAIIWLLALTLATILLAGCAAPWPFPQPTPDPKLPDGQQILRPLVVASEGAGSDFRTLDPAQIWSVRSQQIAQLIFPQIVTLDEMGKPMDWAAERHEVSPDGLTYTFHLRKGLAWSDGAPIDATTFAYSINRALDPCIETWNPAYLYPIKGAQAFNTGTCPGRATKSSATLIGSSLLTSDPLTLQIILQQPTGYFLTALTNPIAWGVPQTLVERYTKLSTDPHDNAPTVSTWTDHLAENGGLGGNLYKLVSWTHAPSDVETSALVVERDERFWGRKPLLRRIEYTLYGSSVIPWIEFTQGKGDIAEPVATNGDFREYPNELARTRALLGVQVTQSLLPSISFLRPNWHIAPFDDVRVRQAFSLALDREALGQEIGRDAGQPSIHLVPEDVPGFNPNLADAAGRTGKNALRADRELALQLATAYAAERCGGSFAACPPVVIDPEYSSAQNLALATAMERQWEETFPSWPTEVFHGGGGWPGDFRGTIQLRLTGWFEDYPDPQSFLSRPFTPPSAANIPSVNIPEVNALCAQADGMQDQGARIHLYQQAEQLLVGQVAAIPLYQPIETTAVRSRVVGWRLAPTSMTPLGVWQQVYVQR
jgi:peptide/nickel transport system substrate-binding protein/oligopeptide transport system substrate-binding protein